MRDGLEILAASTDEFAKRINTAFRSSFDNAFASFIGGSKSAAKAFQDFEKSLLQSLSRIAAQNIGDMLFGNSGSSGGGGSPFGGLFGSLFGSLFKSAGSAGGASSSGGGVAGLGGFLNSIFGSSGGVPAGVFADGGQTNASGAYLVGERGPELFVPRQAGTVVPSGTFGGHTININMPHGAQITRESANLLGATVARHLSQAHARGN